MTLVIFVVIGIRRGGVVCVCIDNFIEKCRCKFFFTLTNRTIYVEPVTETYEEPTYVKPATTEPYEEPTYVKPTTEEPTYVEPTTEEPTTTTGVTTTTEETTYVNRYVIRDRVVVLCMVCDF